MKQKIKITGEDVYHKLPDDILKLVVGFEDDKIEFGDVHESEIAKVKETLEKINIGCYKFLPNHIMDGYYYIVVILL